MTDAALPTISQDAPSARPGRRFSWSWLGLLPFLIFAAAFLIIPTFYLVNGSFHNKAGEFTLQNYADLSQPTVVEAFLASIEISLVTAVIGGVFGFLLAYAVIRGGLPGILGAALMTFSGVASNFAGVPLALAFTFTLGLHRPDHGHPPADRHRHHARAIHASTRRSGSRSPTSTSSSR